ncbi:ZSWIM2 [Symbiodinium sp. CCMP2456]|nr:ZSWIM2 [Symbiodinium sp. CCMP2456]
MSWLCRLPKRPFEVSEIGLQGVPPEPAADQVDRAVERPRRRLRRLAEERSESELFWDAPESERERPHVDPGNIDLSDEAPPPSLPGVGAPFRFQWRTGPTDARAPEPSEPSEPVAVPSESASGSEGSGRPKEGSSSGVNGDGLETEAVELLSSPPLEAQRMPEDLGRRPGDLESRSSPARRRALPPSFASHPSASSTMLPVLEIPESDRPGLAAVLIDEGTEEEEVTWARPRTPGSRRCRRSTGGEDMQIARLLQLEEAAEAGVLPQELLGALPRPCIAGHWRESPMDRTLMAAVSQGGALATAVAESVDRQSARIRGARRFAVTRAACTMICRGCHSDILPGCLMIVCKRDPLGHRTHPAHLACLPLIRGLSRQSAGPGHDDVQFDAGLDAAARSAAILAVEQLPGPAGAFPPDLQAMSAGAFPEEDLVPAEAPSSARRGGAARGTSRRRLQSQLQARLQNGGDFTAEDYDLLLQLDESSSSGAARAEEKCLQQSLVAALPLSKVAAGSTIAQCMICLENMEVGAKIRTLPCMHVFHRKCIDRWLCEPGRKPRCPIDQVEVRLAPG